MWLIFTIQIEKQNYLGRVDPKSRQLGSVQQDVSVYRVTVM